jgi:uncharacterized membrane protein (UPF0127 family)/Skp family chaperone for outer membrane proteins
MIKTHRHPPGIPLLVLLWLAVVPGGLLAQDSVAPRVAIIDLRLAYDNLQDTIDSQHELAILQQQLDQLVKEHKAALDAKEPHANAETPGEDLDEKRLEFTYQENAVKARMVRVESRQMKRGYDQISAAVHDLAASQRLDLVLVAPAINLSAGTEDSNPQAVAGLVFNHSVLFASDNIDITAQVIERCNHTAGKGPAIPSGGPAPTTPLQIGSRKFKLEVAMDPAGQEHGLMERDTLDADHGMIFVFPDEVFRSFWMHHTRFPLDILFLDGHGKVVSVHSMKAYDESSVSSDFPARYAIELSAGQAAAAGVKAGDVVHVPDFGGVPASKRP